MVLCGAGTQADWIVSELFVYPIKSCRPVTLDAGFVTETGLQYDRLWMLMDDKMPRFITQRQCPKLSLVAVTIDSDNDRLKVTAPTMDTPLYLPLHPECGRDLGKRYTVRVWYDDVVGRACGDTSRAWFSQYLDRPVQLLYKDPEEKRIVERYIPLHDMFKKLPQSGFADVFPFHITTEPSLDAVNQQLHSTSLTLTHLHFRPNIVLKPVARNAVPYDEETWKRIEFTSTHGGCRWSMFITSRAPRCSLLNVDYTTGEFVRDTAAQPLQALKEFRCVDAGNPNFACFGVQAVAQDTGQMIWIGDCVQVSQRGEHSLTLPL